MLCKPQFEDQNVLGHLGPKWIRTYITEEYAFQVYIKKQS